MIFFSFFLSFIHFISLCNAYYIVCLFTSFVLPTFIVTTYVFLSFFLSFFLSNYLFHFVFTDTSFITPPLSLYLSIYLSISVYLTFQWLVHYSFISLSLRFLFLQLFYCCFYSALFGIILRILFAASCHLMTHPITATHKQLLKNKSWGNCSFINGCILLQQHSQAGEIA